MKKRLIFGVIAILATVSCQTPSVKAQMPDTFGRLKVVTTESLYNNGQYIILVQDVETGTLCYVLGSSKVYDFAISCK